MPKKSKFDKEKLYELFVEYKDRIYDPLRKKVVNPSQECWKEIAESMDNVITPKHIYTIALTNRDGTLEKLGLQGVDQGEEYVKVDGNENYTSTLEDANIESNTEDGEDILKFLLTLTSDEWSTLYTLVEYSRTDERCPESRTYHKLKPKEWCDTIYSKFFLRTKLPCCLSFKRDKIHPYGQKFLVIEAHCSSCQSRLVGVCYKAPADKSPLTLHCKYIGDFANCTSTKKRRLVGSARDLYYQKIVGEKKSAAFVRREDASEKMEFGYPEPANIPSGNALRCMTYRTQLQHYADNDPFMAICKLKTCSPYNSIIHNIGLDPFYVHYWCTTEINTYRLYCNKNKVPTISIDATGSIVRKMNLLTDRRSRHIFLYEITIHDPRTGTTFSAGHMLSERHNNNSIAFWLGEWLRSDISCPKVAIMDHSLALFMASVRIFTQYSTLPQYLRICSSFIKNEHNSEDALPTCYIRSDFNHLMHTISTWPELKTADKRVKKFYLYSLGLVIASVSYNDVKCLLKKIFIVALHEEDGLNRSGTETACEEAKRYLRNRIGDHNISDNNLENIPDTDSCLDDGYEGDYSDLELNNETYFDDINRLYLECQLSSSDPENQGSHDNMQCQKALAKRILEFCKYLPLWCAVMVPIFKRGQALTASSSASESRFNDIKNRVLQHKKLPIRIDDFLQTHITSIIGETNIYASRYNLLQSNSPSLNVSTPVISENVGDKNCNADFQMKTKEDNQKEEPTDITDLCQIDDQEFEDIPVKESDHSTPMNKEEDIPLTLVKEGDIEKKTNLISTPVELDNNITLTNDTAIENWRGLGAESDKPLKKRKLCNYLSEYPSIMYLNENAKKCHQPIGLLKNGNKTRLRSIQIDKKRYTFMNTCPFDALFQLLYIAFVDSQEYSEFIIKEKKSTLFFQMIEAAAEKGITSDTYRKRGQILLNSTLFANEARNDKSTSNSSQPIIVFNCETSAYSMVVDLFIKKFPSLHQSVHCEVCKSPNERTRYAIMIQLQNIKDLAAVVQDRCGIPICKCKKGDLKNDYGEHLWIETCLGTEQTVELELKDIPITLTIQGKLFYLRGAVQYTPGHYTALGYRFHNSQWEVYDGLSDSSHPTLASKNKKFSCELLFYSK